jgi:hypothetical protein
MSGAPDSEFAKIFELLNGYEGSSDIEPPPPPSAPLPQVQSAAPPKRPQPKLEIPARPLPPRPVQTQPLPPRPSQPQPLPPQPLMAPDSEVENGFAAHIAAAMAKRTDR